MKINSTWKFYIKINLTALIFCLCSGNLLAGNYEYSEFPHHSYQSSLTASSPLQDNYDVLIYDIDLTIEINDTSYISGTVSFDARIKEDDVDVIEINLSDSLTVTAVYDDFGELNFDHENDLITVRFDHLYNTGDTISITTEYWGIPDSNCGSVNQGFEKKTEGNTTIISTLSQPECARSWWPCKDRVDDKADTFYISITVEDTLSCATNGKLTDSIPDLDKKTVKYKYLVSHPMTTYNFAFAISNYCVEKDIWYYNNGLSSMPIYHYVKKPFSCDRINKWKETPELLTFYSDWFGLYPYADEKYGHAQYFRSFMEHQTISFMDSSINAFDNAEYFAHELAHQWWGNNITCSTWNDVWIQEGMATYAEALYFEEYGKSPEPSFDNYMRGKRYEKADRALYDTSVTDLDVLFDTTFTYNKGAWVMHMLRKKLGDDRFKIGLKAITSLEDKYSSITTAQFQKEIENATGIDLEKFFDQWVYGKGIPEYEWSYWYGLANPLDTDETEDKTKILFAYIEQTQDDSLGIFEMPVDIFIDYKSTAFNDTIVTFEIDERTNRCFVEIEGDIDTVYFDQDNSVLQTNKLAKWRTRIIKNSDVPEIPEIDLDSGLVGKGYNDTIYTSDNNSSVIFDIATGSVLPPGLTLESSGLIKGICESKGTFTFFVTASIDGTIVDSAPLTIKINSLPEHFNLYQNYPNPFNNGTIISFDMPKSGNATIDIFNILGQKVTTLIDGFYIADHEYKIKWEGKNDLGRNVSSGIYFYRLKSGEYSTTRKMMLLK